MESYDPRETPRAGELKASQLLDFIIQRHEARKAGIHDDLRFGNEETGGLHSWALPKGLPEPGSKHLAVEQPIHDPEWADFEGEIPEGQYGAGKVTKKEQGKVLINDVQPGKISFVVAHGKYPKYYTLVKPSKDGMGPKNWLLLNTTPTDAKEYAGDLLNKPKFKERKFDALHEHLDRYVAQPKADGASNLFRLNPDSMDVFSYRTSTSGAPIIHSQRFFQGSNKMNIPPELVGTVLRGEILGFKQDEDNVKSASTIPGTVIPPQELGGLLNSSLQRSIEQQKQKKIMLRAMLFDIVGDQSPPEEKYSKLVQISSLLGERFFTPEQVSGPENIRNLYSQIATGKYPLTDEGIMLYPKTGGPPIKVKNTDEHDVYIREIFPGKGKYDGRGAGGFSYSIEPEGEILGEVGTGLSDETREAMFMNPQDFVGRTARVKATRIMPSGAFFQPVMLAVHEDKPQYVYKEASVVQELKKAKSLSDERRYREKVAILQDLLARHREDFVQDSQDRGIAGITHTPSNFRIHIPTDKLPGHVRKMYHGSPIRDIKKLRSDSYVSPDPSIAALMGRYHLDTGKTWDDSDLARPHKMGKKPKWKPGREPKGEPTVYEVEAAEEEIDLLDNPFEHKILRSLSVRPMSKEAAFIAKSAQLTQLLEKSAARGDQLMRMLNVMASHARNPVSVGHEASNKIFNRLSTGAFGSNLDTNSLKRVIDPATRTAQVTQPISPNAFFRRNIVQGVKDYRAQRPLQMGFNVPSNGTRNPNAAFRGFQNPANDQPAKQFAPEMSQWTKMQPPPLSKNKVPGLL